MSGILRIRQLLLINDPGLDTAGFGAYRSGLPGAFGPAAPRFLIPPDGIVAAVAFVPAQCLSILFPGSADIVLARVRAVGRVAGLAKAVSAGHLVHLFQIQFVSVRCHGSPPVVIQWVLTV